MSVELDVHSLNVCGLIGSISVCDCATGVPLLIDPSAPATSVFTTGNMQAYQ